MCLAYVQAQNEYASLDPAGLGRGVYAQRIVSRPGKKDGLYWPTAEGEEPSPLGDLAAQAAAEGYKTGSTPIPYHGYYYRILTRQGAAAPGGAYDYLVKGKMIGGFALIAYPAEYGNSGIMTFMVNQDGTVFQKDLGPKTTAKLVREINCFLAGRHLDQSRRRAVRVALMRPCASTVHFWISIDLTCWNVFGDLQIGSGRVDGGTKASVSGLTMPAAMTSKDQLRWKAWV